MKYFILILFISSCLWGQIKFDADFESGNINTVSTSDSVNFNVTTRSDIGGRWFYFRISGVKNRYINVTVTSSDCNRPFYSYDNRNFTRFTESESPQLNNFRKTFGEDTVYVAYYNPYTYGYLQEKISEWETNKFVKVDTLGFTERDFPMQEVKITNHDIPEDQKRKVWIHARVHPGETPSSFHFEGIVNELLSNKPKVNSYLDSVVFYTVPFANPEGVYYGRSRTNYDGVDCEREYDKPDSQTATEPLIMKNRMIELGNEKPFDVFLNLHSIASSACTFFIHTAGTTSDWFYRRQYQFAYLNTTDNPYFAPGDFSESTLKAHFPEGLMWALYGDQVLALTYETPYDQYSTDEWVSNKNLYEIGTSTVYAIAEFMNLNHEDHFVIDNPVATVSGTGQAADFGKAFFGEDFIELPSGNDGYYAEYQTETLNRGVYKVYGWWQQDNANSFNTQINITWSGNTLTSVRSQKIDGNQWNELREIEVLNPSSLSIKVNQSFSGKAIADAFRIVYIGELTGVEEGDLAPVTFDLSQNYPNPFNPVTTIDVSIHKATDVKLEIFNTLGQKVAVLYDGYLNSGTYNFTFNSQRSGRLASGIYYYRLVTAEQSQTKGMVLLK